MARLDGTTPISTTSLRGCAAAIDYEASDYEVINLGESRTVELRELIALLEKELGVQRANRSAALAARRCAADVCRYQQSPTIARL